MTTHSARLSLGIALAAAACGNAAAFQAQFLFRLSNFSGVVPYSDVQLHADRFHDEVYVGEGDTVRVFNAAGMEIYEFTHHAMKFGTILDLATLENGDILVLSYRPGLDGSAPGPIVTRYDYRGSAKQSFDISGLPGELGEFIPNRMLYRNHTLYFASSLRLLLVLTDLAGAYQSHLGLLVGSENGKNAAEGAELGGLDIDDSGTILYTIPTAFRAFRRRPDGTSEAWGKSGASSGSFSVTGSIVADEGGNILVADRGRSVVLVFDRNLKFVREFGDRGPKNERLRRPGILALGRAGKLYISQLGYRGVSVFSLDPE